MKTTNIKMTTLLVLLLFAVLQGVYAQTEQDILQGKLDSLQKTLTKELNEITVEKRNLQRTEYDTKRLRERLRWEEDGNSQGFYVRVGAIKENGHVSFADRNMAAQTALLDKREEEIQRRQFELQQQEDEIKMQLEELQKWQKMLQEDVERFKQTMLLATQQEQEDAIKKLLVALQEQ